MMDYMKISDICTVNPPKQIELPETAEITFLPMEAVSINGAVDASRNILVSKVKNYSVFRNGDVLFAKITPCMENGKGAVVDGLLNSYGAGSTEFIVLRPDSQKVLPAWIYYYLSQSIVRRNLQAKMTGSAGQKRVPPKVLGLQEIGIPAIDEQKRIISRIEELFSQLDAGIETLRKTQEQLAVYRQAAITNAYPDIQSVPVKRLEEIAEIVGGITKGRDLSGQETIKRPYLRVANVQNGYLDLSEMKEIELKTDEEEKYLLRYGDVLYTEGGDRDKLGRGTVWREEIPGCVHQNHVFKARIKTDIALPEYVAFWSMSTPARNYFYNKGKQSVNLASINKTILSALELPVPSIEQQREVIEQIESRLSVCESITSTVNTALQEAEAMRQSILKEAFEGRL